MKKHLLQSTLVSGLIFSTIFCSFGQSSLPEKREYINVDDARLFVRFVGSGEPLIIIHGGPGLSHDYLAPQLIDLLAKDYQLVFYDQRASGRSSGVDDTTRLTISQFANDLEMLRQQLEINRLNLLGHSFGGLLAMYYAISYPDNVNKLLLIDTAPASWELNFPYFWKTISDRQTENDKQELTNLKSKNDFGTNPELMDRYFKIYFKPFFKDSSFSQQLSFGIDENWISKFNVTNGKVWNNLGHYDIHNKLKNINAPTLIMHGDFSVLSVDGAKAIERMIRNSKLVILKDVGHFPYMEDPKAFTKTVRTFLRKN